MSMVSQLRAQRYPVGPVGHPSVSFASKAQVVEEEPSRFSIDQAMQINA